MPCWISCDNGLFAYWRCVIAKIGSSYPFFCNSGSNQCVSFPVWRTTPEKICVIINVGLWHHRLTPTFIIEPLFRQAEISHLLSPWLRAEAEHKHYAHRAGKREAGHSADGKEKNQHFVNSVKTMILAQKITLFKKKIPVWNEKSVVFSICLRYN